MIFPIHIGNDGSWLGETFGFFVIGYAGLASHGGTLGLMIALWLYVKKTKLSIWTVLDNIAIATGSMACCIRLGNLMNSEIIGKITDVPWAFIFERVDAVPRHPGQLYEAIAYAVLFCIMWVLHKKMPEKIGTGWYFGFCLAYIFTFRFFITRYGTDPIDSLCYPWGLLHDKSQEENRIISCLKVNSVNLVSKFTEIGDQIH